jgi:hypothetical protein
MAQYTAKVRKKSNGDVLEVASGGSIDILSGGALKLAGSSINPVAGVGSGYKIARGEATLDGSNPTPVATGLATIVAAAVVQKSSTTPGDDPSAFTVDYTGSDGTLNIYAWKNTGGTDPTLVASTNNAAVVSWLAIGT